LTADDLLVDRAKRGDRAALEELLEKHLSMVYRFVTVRLGAQRADVEDVVQETLIGAAGSIHSLRADRDGSVPKWLLAIARHKLADHYRRSSAIPPAGADGGAIAADHQVADVTEIAEAWDRRRRLREALRELTAEQSEVLEMRFILGFDLGEVAAITGRSIGAVKALQHRGLASLEKLLASEVWT
jgi:RNA polymerase sigma-70 factor (ECF subfamily)